MTGPLRPGVPAVGQHPLRALEPARRTVNDLLLHTVGTRPDGDLLGSPGDLLSAAELLAVVQATAGALAGWGVRPGDRVAVMSENRVDVFVLLLSCGWSGAVFVPINSALRGEALTHQLTLSEPALVVVDDEAAAVLGERGPTQHSWADLAAARSAATPVEKPAAEVEPGSTLALLWTSGTTGPSKAVQIPHGQLFWWPVIATEQMQLGPDDVLYTCLPLFHTNSLTTFLQAMACGGRAVLGPKFSVSRHWDRLAEAGATVTYLLGAMGSMLWNRRPAEPPQHSVRRVLGGGMSGGLKPLFEEFYGIEVLEGFGMTELGVPIYTPVGDDTVHGMGVLHPDYEARVVDQFDVEVAPGTPGELVVRPRQPHLISSGYHRNPEATVDSRRNLWFHTGDVVSLAADGCFTFVDRKSDSVRRRGENISCFEVERALETLAGVKAVAAYPVPSGLGDDEVMVAVVGDGTPLSPEAVVVQAAGVLAAHAIPRYIRFVTELPLTPNGKIRKNVLKDDGITGDAWDREAGP